jgi:hypothetical protein
VTTECWVTTESVAEKLLAYKRALLQAIELYARQRARLEKAQETLRPPLCGTMDSA